jgi:predicted alpha/beta-fold hydrolase
MTDGGVMSMDWNDGVTKSWDRIIIILHGLTGGSDCEYIKYIVNEADKLGYKVGVL